jgi:hypothetical protein
MNLPDKFFRDGKVTTASKDHSIHRSYQHFISFYAQKDSLTEHDIVIGAFFTYGWMPTMLDLRGDLTSTIEILNRVKADGIRPTTKEIKSIASHINGSVVGTSKLMHFIRPDVHAIWDSRVYRYLHQKRPYIYRLEAPDVYAAYLDLIGRLAQDARFPGLKENLESQIGYEVSDTRIAEYVMYHHGADRTGEQVETQQPPLAALSATSPVV